MPHCSWLGAQPRCYCLCAHLSIAVCQPSIHPSIHPSDSLAEQPGVSQACCTLLCCKRLYFCWLGKSCWSQFLLKYFVLKRGKEAELQSLGAPFAAKLNFFRSAANSYQHCVFQHLVLEGDLVKPSTPCLPLSPWVVLLISVRLFKSFTSLSCKWRWQMETKWNIEVFSFLYVAHRRNDFVDADRSCSHNIIP